MVSHWQTEQFLKKNMPELEKGPLLLQEKLEGKKESHKILTDSAFNADTITPAQLCTPYFESPVVHWE